MEIRKVRFNELKDLLIIKKSGWDQEYKNSIFDNKRKLFDFNDQLIKIEELYNKENIIIIVAADEFKIYGYLTCGETIHEYNNIPFEISALYVLDKYRGQGIGKSLMKEAIKIFNELKYSSGFVSCNYHNELGLKFYRNLGLEELEIDINSKNPINHQVRFKL